MGKDEQPTTMDNSYHLFSAGGMDWLVLALRMTDTGNQFSLTDLDFSSPTAAVPPFARHHTAGLLLHDSRRHSPG
jgi:hypothetical protein